MALTLNSSVSVTKDKRTVMMWKNGEKKQCTSLENVIHFSVTTKVMYKWNHRIQAYHSSSVADHWWDFSDSSFVNCQ